MVRWGCSIVFRVPQDKTLKISYAENRVINVYLIIGRNRGGVTGGENV